MNPLMADSYRTIIEMSPKNFIVNRQMVKDHDWEIQYHPGKTNVVTDALSRKQSIELNQAQCLSFTYAMLECFCFYKRGLVALLERFGQRCCCHYSVLLHVFCVRTLSFRISGRIWKYLQQSEGGLSSYVVDYVSESKNRLVLCSNRSVVAYKR